MGEGKLMFYKIYCYMSKYQSDKLAARLDGRDDTEECTSVHCYALAGTPGVPARKTGGFGDE